jgi:lysozyme family protein
MALTRDDLRTAQAYLVQKTAAHGTDFGDSITEVLLIEGGLNSDVRDNGGLTKYGISQRAYPMLDIRNLSITKAIDIYFEDYWVRGGCHRLHFAVQKMHFDACVNHGVGGAGLALQRAFNELRMNSTRLAVDGVVGPGTARAVNSCATIPGRMPAVLTEYFVERMAIYAGHEDWAAFGEGWTRRLGKIFGNAMVRAYETGAR